MTSVLLIPTELCDSEGWEVFLKVLPKAAFSAKFLLASSEGQVFVHRLVLFTVGHLSELTPIASSFASHCELPKCPYISKSLWKALLPI